MITCMLSLPAEYWKSLLMNERDHVISSVIDANINTDCHSTDRGKQASHPLFIVAVPNYTQVYRFQVVMFVCCTAQMFYHYFVPCSIIDRLFKPLTSPEMSKYQKTPTSGSLKGKIKTLGHAFNNT